MGTAEIRRGMGRIGLYRANLISVRLACEPAYHSFVECAQALFCCFAQRMLETVEKIFVTVLRKTVKKH